jgi:DNA-directed RNA polymerase specialized sigma24 family protein
METEELIPLFAIDEAACVLVDRHGREVYAVCYRYTFSPENAEIATANTWLTVQRLHPSYLNKGPGSGRAWLRRLATNEAHTVRRAEARYNGPLDRGADIDSVASPEAEEEAVCRLIELLPDLTPQQQVVLMLTDPRCQGSGSNPGQDVALLLTINRKGVTPEVADALAALKKLYDESF